MSESRKLAAIFAADVVGFSRLAGADEDRILARLRALRSDLIDPTIEVHRGRVVKRTGDGVLAEFRSVVDAVRCAVEVQNSMVERNAGVPEDRRIVFRIGIHIGEVVAGSIGSPRRKEYTVIGDTVNFAARIEALNKEFNSQFLISQAVRDAVGDEARDAVALGEVPIRGYDRPMAVWQLG